MERLIDAMSGSTWTYLLVFAVVAGDAVLPLLPGETIVVTGGVLAAGGELNVLLIALAGAAGAFLGDTVTYLIGRQLGAKAARRFLRGERGKRSLEWAERMLERRGMVLIAAARFVPGGRTATTFTAGSTHFPWPRFAAAAAIGAVVWSAYNTALGRIGGETFKEQPWKGLLLAIGLAAGTALLIEGVRWLVSRLRRGKLVG
jgi:membrane-associated protein